MLTRSCSGVFPKEFFASRLAPRSTSSFIIVGEGSFEQTATCSGVSLFSDFLFGPLRTLMSAPISRRRRARCSWPS